MGASLMYTWKSRFLTRGEVWFDGDRDNTRLVDCIRYQQRSQPVPGARSKLFDTYFIDLSQPAEQLQANLNTDTAYKIRRARERDKIVCECCDARDPDVLGRFEEMYNAFAATKGLPALDRPRINAMANAGVLDLSVAKDSNGRALVYHANYRNRTRARELFLPSLFRQLSDSAARNMIGRANRYLTWSDVLRYKHDGLRLFDFGGWYSGNDPAMLKINDFKKGFGGQVLREYECEQILTLKGWLAFKVARLLKQAKRLSGAPKKLAETSPPTQANEPSTIPSSI